MTDLLDPINVLTAPVAAVAGDADYLIGIRPGATDKNGIMRFPKDLVATIGIIPSFEPTREFYSDEGAQIARFGDRLFVGDAARNDGASDRDNRPSDWLTEVMAKTSIGGWGTWRSQLASLSSIGATGITGASRTSDAVAAAADLGSVPSSIGIASWGIADSVQNPTQATAYAFYGEAWRMTGADYQPTIVMELEAVNLGGDAYGETTPYHINTGGGVYGIQIGSGGGQTYGTSDAEAAITIVKNNSRFKSGIVFGADALTGTDGTRSGYGSAITFAARQGLEWTTPETVENVQGANSGAMVWSSVTTSRNGQRIEFSDSGLLFENSSGNLLFSIQPSLTPNATLQIQPGSGQYQAAGLYVNHGNNGSPNLMLGCAEGGNLQISSTTTGTGAKPFASSPAFGFLNVGVDINGKWQQARIALWSPAQVGG